MERYNFKKVEEKWQEHWAKHKTFLTKIDKNKKKFYCLEMFPYPSGKIHMGHVRNYTIGDVLARYKTLQGFNVLHPMGWDSFGMPAENAARQNNLDPKTWTESNISNMKVQLKKLGLSIDWDREISTCSEEYYKHQQKFFLELYRKGLVYRKENYVNWDPVDQTVLANEQVIDGKGWRSGATVERKKLNQWFFNISKFSQELLDGLEKLDDWPNKVKVMQKNWIGKSFGCEIDFNIKGDLPVNKIKCFTTRPDTLFGFSFLALSVDHEISSFFKDDKNFIKFKEECSKTGTTEEAIAVGDKIGFKTNLKAINPLNPNDEVPVYFANFVLMDYGFGAVFGCPAHDQRDLDFALKYKLKVKPVVKPKDENDSFEIKDQAYTGPGVIFNSKFLDNLKVPDESILKSIEIIEKKSIGKKKMGFLVVLCCGGVVRARRRRRERRRVVRDRDEWDDGCGWSGERRTLGRISGRGNVSEARTRVRVEDWKRRKRVEKCVEDHTRAGIFRIRFRRGLFARARRRRRQRTSFGHVLRRRLPSLGGV